MLKNYYKKNEKALTLIEVLASLVILGIVLVGFMTIFPQMTLFNKKTETKLDTMNLARQEIALIKEQAIRKKLTPNENNKLTYEKIQTIVNPSSSEYSTPPLENTIGIKYEESGHDFEVDFSIDPELKSTGHLDNTALYKAHLKIKVNGIINSESYGYIEVVKE